MTSFERGNIRAPELFGDFWLNGDPVMMQDLRGRVLLLEFWDYTNVNSLRAEHYMSEWYSRYRDFELVVIGIHTPQFSFARNLDNVEAAIKRLGISYPVVMDNDAIIWTAYSNRVWPTRYLIDRDGFLRFSHQGEGSYEPFERAIQSLLIEAGYHGQFPELVPPLRNTDAPGAVCLRSTGEIQLGYLRGTLGNPEAYSPESTLLYEDDGYHLSGRVYLKGKWYNDREGVRFDGERGDEGHASFTYEALEVNSVMKSEGTDTKKVLALQDQKPLTKANAGFDIQFDADGQSFLLVDAPRMFNVVTNHEFGEHEIALTTTSAGLEIFSFSFVTSVVPELVSVN